MVSVVVLVLAYRIASSTKSSEMMDVIFVFIEIYFFQYTIPYRIIKIKE